MGHLRSLALAGAVLAALPAAAAELHYEAGLSYGHSDNIRRTAENQVSEDIAAANLRFSLDENTRRLRADVVGDLAWNEYLDDTFDSELTGNFAGNATFGLLPERIEWFVGDSFGQVLSDPFLPATPENRENINQFATGPNFYLGFGSQMRLQLNARYVLTDFERLPFDSESYRGEIGLVRLLSGRSAISMNLRSEDVTLDEAALQGDYTNTEAFLRYDISGARTNLRTDVGWSQLDRDAATDAEDGLLLRIDASRRLSASSTAQLSAGREFSNAGSAFAGGLSSTGVDISITPGRQSALPFTSDHATLRWTFDRHRTGLGLFGTWAERTYEDEPLLDQTMTTLGVLLRRDLSPNASLFAEAGSTRGDFAQPGGEYDEINAGLSLNWRLTRHLTLQFSYDYLDRDGEALAASFEENRIWLSVLFGSGRPRSTFAPPTFGADPAP
jgi:hypothetical protein